MRPGLTQPAGAPHPITQTSTRRAAGPRPALTTANPAPLETHATTTTPTAPRVPHKPAHPNNTRTRKTGS
jgi:hypothetical protein